MIGPAGFMAAPKADTTRYRIFKRKAYKKVKNAWGTSYVPNPGARCYDLGTVTGIEAARRYCEQGPANRAMEAGKEYRHLSFYEFTRED